jgi:hypothetical protein
LDPASTPLLVMGFAQTAVQLGDASALPVTPAPATTAIIVALNAVAAAFNALTAPSILLPATWQAIATALITAISPPVTGPVATTKTLAK